MSSRLNLNKDIKRVCSYCGNTFQKQSFYSVTTTKCTYDGKYNYCVEPTSSLILCDKCGEMFNKSDIKV